MKLYLIRHGQTDWNLEGRVQGRQDMPLNQAGREQAALLAKGMDSRPVGMVFASPLRRGWETAQILAKRQQVLVEAVDQLQEVGFGQWEGMKWQEVKRLYGKEYEAWLADPVKTTPPGGESPGEAMERCAQALEKILRAAGRGMDLALVSHGAILACMAAYMLGEGQESEHRIVENASISTVVYDPLAGTFQMEEANDVSHLLGQPLAWGSHPM